ncbi:PLP-dependent cysteine synthase family protein [Planctomycetaceae bacterium SH139]
MSNAWVHDAISRIESDFNRSADTHLIRVPLPGCDGIDFYLKDESIHPSGSLKHRLARSLFLYAICNGWINEGTPVIEASSGSTAISEAYFAKLLDLPFHTVIPASTSREKIHKIQFLGGHCHLEPGGDMYQAAADLAAEMGGYYMDQFTYAERATDWRGNNNIAESLFRQMQREPFPEPTWVVVGAGTGGTSATIGRYIRYQKLNTKLCVADPERSVFFDYFHSANPRLRSELPSRVEGVGRPRVEPSFIPSVIDHMIRVPDAASFGAIHAIEPLLDRKCGGSTGTNLWASFQLISEMRQRGQRGSVVSIICDAGERYLQTYYNHAWLAQEGIETKPYCQFVQEFLDLGHWDDDTCQQLCALADES